MKLFKALIIIFLGCVEGGFAQDLHFSNPQLFQSYFNPALTGGDVDQWSVGLQHRSQWATLGEGFQTAGVFLEKKENRLGYGGQIYQNNAGDSSLKTIRGKGSFGYTQPLSSGNNFLHAGASIGFLQRSFNTALMTFDEQYVEDVGFDSELSNGERFSETSRVIIDGSVGLVWRGSFGESRKIDATLGAAVHNFHKPKEGFLTEAVLSMKQVFQGQLDIPINSKTILKPFAFYQKQGLHKEILVGLNFNKKVNKDCDVELGMANRMEDAWVIMGALQWGNTKVIASYDYNTSGLKSATNGRGAIEVGLKMNFGLSPKGISTRLPIPEANIPSPTPNYTADKPAQKLNEKKLYEDSDNDGVRDMDDDCPHLAGDFKNNGCPDGFKDTDRDGVPDDKDFCIHIKGSPEFNGCPDTDGDGISDIDDRCPYLKGERASNGCPE